MKPILVDTSAWVEFLGPGTQALGDHVDQALEADQARICGGVVAELLHGVRGEREQKQMRWLQEKVQRIPTLEQDWDEAGKLMQCVRERGLTVPLTDALIATVAKRNGIAVLTADAHFRHLGVEMVQLD